MEEKYLEALIAQIREKRAREQVYHEVKGHLDDQKAAYVADGMTDEEAEERAVADMGDPLEAGTALDMLHRPRPAWGMLAAIAALCTAGLLLQYAVCKNVEGNGYYFGNQCRNAAVGMAVLTLVYLADYTRLAQYCRQMGACLLAALGLLYFSGAVSYNGVWVSRVNGMGISLSMLLYLYVPVYAAILYTYRGRGRQYWMQLTVYTLLPVLGAYYMPNILQALNLEMIFAVIGSAAVMQGWYGRSKKKTLAAVWGAAAGAPAFVLLAGAGLGASYRRTRIWAWFTMSPSEGAGYTYRTIRGVLDASGLIGGQEGLRVSERLPDIPSDYLLTYLAGTYGILAAAALILAILLLGAYFLRFSIRQKNRLGRMMGLGCSLVFGLQAVEYILMDLGLFPATRVYLPLVSYGGSGMVQSCFLLGLLLSIYRYQHVAAEPDRLIGGEGI